MTTCLTPERLRSVAALTQERLTLAGVEGALGMELEELTESSMTFGAPVPPRDGVPDPVGLVALTCVLCDTGAGLASAFGRAFGEGGATIELRVDHAAVPGPGTRRLSLEAEQCEVGTGVALAATVLRDDAGRVLARSRGHFLTLPDVPDMFPDPAPGESVGRRYERLREALTLEPATDPADRTIALPPELANTRGGIHGGTAMAIVELAQREVRAAALADPRRSSRLLSMQMEYLRPAACDGSRVACTSRYERRGRRINSLRTELTGPGGRLIAVATGLWATDS